MSLPPYACFAKKICSLSPPGEGETVQLLPFDHLNSLLSLLFGFYFSHRGMIVVENFDFTVTIDRYTGAALHRSDGVLRDGSERCFRSPSPLQVYIIKMKASG